ncbi:cereblon family protein [Magnetospirillum sulfuroxidans]|uniref:CULT domain-containing protein n=1 Tax=Magnetospirillum sulfuroxidans TaxID=611300 RepID=A0ABS5IAJ9_9PROT|nr:cereblon family protein [Magnetospirillum sulfuroxidans]MBR9970778.1 hypothetical protein [Magnetospirillum sulfuroxidans]
MPLDAGGKTDADAALAPGAKIWRCRHCRRIITRRDWLRPMGGDHEHVVFNPAGMIFRVWCFDQAQGLRLVGPPSAEFSWFRGYAWTIAQCGQCGSHLGWRYDDSAQPDTFFGLIKDRLAEGPAD